MLISELFVSLQGEGVLVGTPSFFIRTSGCNLRCRWCDTPYASWQPEGERVPVEEIVRKVSSSPLRHVVVTGGEPLLQREISTLTRELAALDRHITIETAGTVAPPVHCDLLSLSPKTACSDPDGSWRSRHRTTRANLEPAARLLERFPGHQVKFVVSDVADIDEILAVLSALPPVRSDRVLLMPEGRSAREVAIKAPEVARLCLEHGFRYTPRLHLDLYGGKRGH